MQIIVNALRGALIGAAELVPGISGGTVALIVGIYERALHNANNLFKLQFKKVEWGFLATVAVGMFASVFGLSTVLHNFVENQVSLSNALFMGMVTISIMVPLLMIPAADRLGAKNVIAFVLAAIAIFFITGLRSGAVENPSKLVIFGAAAIAICALILPGISGSLILLTMGLYQPIIGAVSERDFGVIAIFALGALFGLAAFVKLLNWLLSEHRNVTLAAMAGFMLGSLRSLWPFGETQDAGVGAIIAMFLLGVAIVGAFIYVDYRKAAQMEQGHEQKVN